MWLSSLQVSFRLYVSRIMMNGMVATSMDLFVWNNMSQDIDVVPQVEPTLVLYT